MEEFTKSHVMYALLKCCCYAIISQVARGFTRGAFEVKPFTEDNESENQRKVSIPVLRPTETKTKHPGKKVTLFPVKKWKGGKK